MLNNTFREKISLIKKSAEKKFFRAYQTRYKLLDYFLFRLLRSQEKIFGSDRKVWSNNLLGVINKVSFFPSLAFKGTNENLALTLLDVYQSTSRKYIVYRLADISVRHRFYNIKTESLFEFCTNKNREVNANLRALDFYSQVYGYKNIKKKICIRRLVSKPIRRVLTKRQKVRLLIYMLHQRGFDKNNPLANQIFKEVGKRFASQTSQSLYFYSQAYVRFWLRDEETKTKHLAYKDILSNRKKFVKLISSEPGDFCIVGNAPTEIGSLNGADIDRYKYVIRINSYGLDRPEDYGSKETIWFRVANDEVGNRHLKNNQMVVFVGNNFAVKRTDAYDYILPCQIRDVDYTAIPSHVFSNLISRLGGLPSTGLAILYWIYLIVGKIPRTAIYGFSHKVGTEDRDFQSHYYIDSQPIADHLHVWEREVEIFGEITE